MPSPFENWSGSVRFTPASHRHPRDETEVVELVQDAEARGARVRPVGSAHSSMPLFETPDVLVSLEHLAGVRDHDEGAGWAEVGPGTGLADLGAQLHDRGVALANLGDVDYQAIAGAVGTGTHGSGLAFGPLSSFVTGGRLVAGGGQVVAFGDADGGEAGEDRPASDLLRAAQVSLGGLGIFTELRLQVEEATLLHRQNWCTHIDWVLEHFDAMAEAHRHFDVYWYPRSDLAQVRTLNVPGEEPELAPPGRLRTDETGPRHEVIPNDRDLRYEEMEYMLPYEAGLDCFREARERIKRRHRSIVGWRVLLRTIAGDDAMLSPCQGRTTMSLALLQNHELPYEGYFADMEPLLLDHGGRPHWGKKHSLRGEALAERYPDWERWRAIRRDLDPDGTFLNDHLRDLLGEAA